MIIIRSKSLRLVKAVLKTVFFRLFKLVEKIGFHIYPIHFYSPIPDTRELKRTEKYWFRENGLLGVDVGVSDQFDLQDKLKRYQNEFLWLPNYSEVQKMGMGSGYGEIESLLLYAMVRYLKPIKVIEVGFGISTYFSGLALKKNKEETGHSYELICIEPFPYPGLQTVTGVTKLVQEKVQFLNAEFFDGLSSNDILFIDSSHVLKAGSDVAHLYLEVIPRLQNGVVIHIHDIAFPYPARSATQVIDELAFSQEQYLVQAFLSFNTTFKILYCSSYLHFKHPEKLKELFPIYDSAKHFPSSLWIQKVK